MQLRSKIREFFKGPASTKNKKNRHYERKCPLITSREINMFQA